CNLQKAVFCVDAIVLRDIGVIDAACLEIKHLGGKQRGQADGSGRADDDLGELFPLNIIEHPKNRRETQFLQLVFGQLEFADRFELLDRDVVDVQLVGRSQHD